jgi:hypothetical protein
MAMATTETAVAKEAVWSTYHVVGIRRHQSGYLGYFARMWHSSLKHAQVGDIHTPTMRHGRMRI